MGYFVFINLIGLASELMAMKTKVDLRVFTHAQSNFPWCLRLPYNFVPVNVVVWENSEHLFKEGGILISCILYSTNSGGALN